MSFTCRLMKLMCLKGVCRQSTILLDYHKIIYYQQLLIRYSSKSCDSGKSDSSSKCPGSSSDKTTPGSSGTSVDKSSSQSPGSGTSGSDKTTGKGDSDPCDPCYCPCPPSNNNPSSPTMYDLRKYGHSLPKRDVNMCFEPLPHIPTGIFRNTDCETLGLGAGKCCLYKNPEYFSFHHMTYYDMHLILRCFRKPSPITGRKP